MPNNIRFVTHIIIIIKHILLIYGRWIYNIRYTAFWNMLFWYIVAGYMAFDITHFDTPSFHIRSLDIQHSRYVRSWITTIRYSILDIQWHHHTIHQQYVDTTSGLVSWIYNIWIYTIITQDSRHYAEDYIVRCFEINHPTWTGVAPELHLKKTVTQFALATSMFYTCSTQNTQVG
jgi:hypothetical protein